MARLSVFSAPFLLGFETFEERVDRLSKSAEGYPPYNIERLKEDDGERFLISVAVAGFGPDDLEVMIEDNQIIVRGRQSDDPDRQFLHRGIAARQFQRSFLLADGMTVEGADLRDGMLIITVVKPHVERQALRIEIRAQ